MKTEIKKKIIRSIENEEYRISRNGSIKYGDTHTIYGILVDLYIKENNKTILNLTGYESNNIDFFESIKIKYRNEIIEWAELTDYDFYILDICEIMCIRNNHTFKDIAKYINKTLIYEKS